MPENFQLTAGIDFPWKHIRGYFMCIRSFTSLTQIVGDKVGSSILGAYGMVHAELPNPDVEANLRKLSLPIKNKSDIKSVYRANLDAGVKDGTNEIVLVYEHRPNLLGQLKPSFHLAIYPTGTWDTFFEAVKNYKAQDFKWSKPLILFQPSNSTIFPTTTNIFSR